MDKELALESNDENAAENTVGNAAENAENNTTDNDVRASTSAAEAGFDDEGLASLFSAFDEVRASDSLKQETLKALHEGGLPQSEKSVGGNAANEGCATTQSSARAGKKARTRSKWRALRVAAVAACLVLAFAGGAAYAIPASRVTVGQGGAAADLGVNIFGMTVSAQFRDAEGKQVETSEELSNRPYIESLERAYEVLNRMHPDQPIDVIVDGAFDGQRRDLEDQSAAFVDERQGRSEDNSAPWREGQVQRDESDREAPDSYGQEAPGRDQPDDGQIMPREGSEGQDAQGAERPPNMESGESRSEAGPIPDTGSPSDTGGMAYLGVESPRGDYSAPDAGAPQNGMQSTIPGAQEIGGPAPAQSSR